MSNIIAVAGGSGGLGRSIVTALKADGRYDVIILGRKTNPKLEEESGARVLAADYADVDALVKLFEDNNVSTVISTVNSLMDTTPEFNLIKAATTSKVTKRFIPNAWSALVFTPDMATLPMAATRLRALDELRKSGLEWTAIYPGVFMEYFVSGLPTHLSRYSFIVDIENNAAGLPGDGEAPITLTYTADIAKYTAALLGLEKWEERYLISGDVKTWNEIVAAVEAGKGVKFNVAYDPVEKLQRGEITELPGHEKSYEIFGGKEFAKPIVQQIYAQYGQWMIEGRFKYSSGTFLSNVFPDIKPLTLDAAWKEVAGKN